MKGAVEIAAMALFSLVLSGILLGFGMGGSDAIKNRLYQESTGLTADRVAGDVLAIDSYSSGSLQVDLHEEYGFSVEGRKINISKSGQWSISNITQGITLNVENEGKTRYLCITKQDTGVVTLRGDTC